MKINESKNLKHDKMPWMESDQGLDRFNPGDCCLEKFSRVDDKINLYFRNGSLAVIRAINIEGGREVDLIEDRLNESLGKTYEEILETRF